MACGGGAPNMNLENLDPSTHDKQLESRYLSVAACMQTGLEDYYSWLTAKTGVGLTTRLLLTDQQATRTNTPTRKRWSYLVVTLPNSRMQIGTWTMVYDEGFEEDHADGKAQRKWGCFYAEKETPSDAEETFVVSGHGYGLPNLPVPTPASPFGHRQGSWVAKHNQFSDTPPAELAMYKGHMGYQKFHKKMEYALPTFLQKYDYAVKPPHDKPYACDIPVVLNAESANSPLPAEW
ncbi:hypothetical protein Emed_004476 [Eimeria media]